MEDNNLRKTWIDTLKGLVILFIVFWHMPSVPPILHAYLNNFQTPLFFFISGYLFNWSKYANDAVMFFKTRLSRLLVPFICFSIISYIFLYLFGYIIGRSINPLLDRGVIQIITGILVGQYSQLVNKPLWFLSCLFLVEIIYYLYAKISNDNEIIILMLLSASIIVFLYMPNYRLVDLPYRLDFAFVFVFFYGIGNLFQKYDGVLFKTKLSIIAIISLFSIIISIKEQGSFYDLISLTTYIIAALSCIIVYTYMFKEVEKYNLKICDILSYFGRNTMVVLCTQDILLFILQVYLPEMSNLVYFGIMLIMFIPLIIFFNKYARFMIGSSIKYTLSLSQNSKPLL